MKFFNSKQFWVITTLISILGYVVSCTKKDQVIINNPVTNTSTLVSMKTGTAPVIDGIIDPIWGHATKLNVTATVPDPGNGTFEGYIGANNNVTLRSMYDATNVYFLVQWNDPDQSLLNTPVSYNPTTKLWSRQSNNYTFDSNGNITSIPFNEDKFGFQWNINNSITQFATLSCYATCHLNTATQSLNSSNVIVTVPASAGGNHYTNGPRRKS